MLSLTPCVFTVTVNMAGLPGIAVPAGLDHKGLPLGLQLIGKPFEEESLFPEWEDVARCEGLHVRVGRWTIPSRC